jgi:hypothetical protein
MFTCKITRDLNLHILIKLLFLNKTNSVALFKILGFPTVTHVIWDSEKNGFGLMTIVTTAFWQITLGAVSLEADSSLVYDLKIIIIS